MDLEKEGKESDYWGELKKTVRKIFEKCSERKWSEVKWSEVKWSEVKWKSSKRV